MMSVRHPLARLYSAWKDKFRNGHPWYKFLNNKFGVFFGQLEQKDMSEVGCSVLTHF